jgi:ribosomal protein S18 acetylase RimI-like enzyme
MKWNHEKEFDDVAKFLGKLFNKTPEEISERFVDIPEMYVLTFKDDSEIKGVIVSIRDDRAYNILEILFVAFEPSFDFKKTNLFNKLNNYCKKEYIDVIFTHTISENSFVNIDIEQLSKVITIHDRALMKLSLSDYKEKWYDPIKEELPKIPNDKIGFQKKFKSSRGKKSKKFQFVSVHDISWSKVADVQNKVYSNTEFKDNLHLLSKNTLDYNNSLIKRLFSGYYGQLCEENSYIALTDDGEVAGYIVNLDPVDKRGYIADFAVEPSNQGYGLGKVLLRNAVIKYFEELGCEEIGLAVTLENKNVIEFYVQNGFQFKLEQSREGILFID